MASTEMTALERDFKQAQDGVLERYGIEAESRFLDVAAVGGRAQVLVAGEGPPVVMVMGGGGPGAFWAPLMAELRGFTLYVVDRPGFGLTDTARHTMDSIRPLAVNFLEQVLDGLELKRPLFVSNSMGSLWSSWFAIDRPERVAAMVQVGCAATILGTSAPAPMRLLAVPWLGKLMMRMQPPSEKQVVRVVGMMKEDVSELPELRDVMLACERLPSYTPTWLALLHAVVRLRGARPEVALDASELGRLSMPVQVIWGEDDPFGGLDVGERVAEAIPDARFHSIPGGHTPWVSEAPRIGELARPFLFEHAGQTAAAGVSGGD